MLVTPFENGCIVVFSIPSFILTLSHFVPLSPLHQTLYYCLRVVEVPVVRFHRTFWNVSIVEKAQLMRRRFYPIFWMTNRHLQTVLGAIAADLTCKVTPIPNP